jgi:predicted phosphodiesterase
MTRPRPHLWTADEDAALIRLRVDTRLTWQQISEQMGLRHWQCMQRWMTLKEQGRLPAVVPARIGGPYAVVADVPIPVTHEEPLEEWRQVVRASDVTEPIPIPVPPPPPSGLLPPDADIERLLKITKHGIELEALCDRLDMSPAKVRALIAEAKTAGYTVDVAGPHVGHRPVGFRTDASTIIIQPSGPRRIFAQITDLHFGSKYHLGAQLADFVNLAYGQGVRTMLVTGDIMEGNYRHARWELTHHGYQDQASFVAQTLPRLPGLTYHGITGNHDETFEKDAGLSICHALVETFRAHGRDDLTMYGQRAARLVLRATEEERGLIVDLWHPLKGPAYALSYKLQKYIEGYAPGAKADVLFAGHWHQSVYFTSRGVHAFSGGTFQGGGGPFGNALGGSPSIGGWIVEYAQTPDGTVRRFKPEWIAYFESEHAREVAV